MSLFNSYYRSIPNNEQAVTPMEWLLMPYWLTRPLGHCQLYTLKFMLQSCRDMFLAENLPRGHMIWIEMCLIGHVNWGLVYSEYIWMLALIHSSGAVDRILRLVELIPCLLMLWFPKSPKHQRVQHWLCRTDNKHGCSRVHFIDLNQAKSKIWLKMWIYLQCSLKRFSVLKVNWFGRTQHHIQYLLNDGDRTLIRFRTNKRQHLLLPVTQVRSEVSRVSVLQALNLIKSVSILYLYGPQP